MSKPRMFIRPWVIGCFCFACGFASHVCFSLFSPVPDLGSAWDEFILQMLLHVAGLALTWRDLFARDEEKKLNQRWRLALTAITLMVFLAGWYLASRNL